MPPYCENSAERPAQMVFFVASVGLRASKRSVPLVRRSRLVIPVGSVNNCFGRAS